jgi:hypothetical protein
VAQPTRDYYGFFFANPFTIRYGIGEPLAMADPPQGHDRSPVR